MATTLEVSAPAPIPGTDLPGEAADEREHFADITNENPDEHSEFIKRAFVASKINMVRTHPTLDPADRVDVLSDLLRPLGQSALEMPDRLDIPVPGGVGYGVFYNTPFKTNFSQGTAVYWDVICPDVPAGNVNTWLYVTAMNRAARGIEAFVSYFAQQPPRFKVFDWARSDHWQIDVPWSSMSNYLRTVPAHGASYQVLGIWNTTFQLSPGQWRNEAWLWNRAMARYDLSYRFDYPAMLPDQTNGFPGSWGPIVETFQPSYNGTNPLGCLATQTATRDSAGNWSPWQLVGPSQGYIRTDNVGFRPVFIDPYYAFAVKS